MSARVAPLNIAILVNELNVRGGTHKQVQRLADYLLRRQHKCVVLTYAFDPERCFPGIERIRVEEIPSPHPHRVSISMSWVARKVSALRRVMRMLQAIPADVDIVNLHDSGLCVLAILVRWLRPKTRIVWQINDLPPYFGVGVHKGKYIRLYDRAKRLLFRWAARNVAAVTVNVTKNKKRIETELGISAQVIYCGVDIRESEAPQRPERALPIKLVSTGVLFPHRNYETLLSVQSELQKRYGLPSEISIVGATDADPAYAAKIRRLIETGSHKASLLGEIDEDQLARIYRASHWFLFLNIDQSWGLAVFEAMNYGLPTVVSESVGATELLHDGIDCLVRDPKDAAAIAEQIAICWTSELLMERLSSNAHVAVKEMTWDNMYSRRVEELFYELVQQ